MKKLKLLFLLFGFSISALSAQEDDKIYKVVEEPPTFPGCEEEADPMERTKCAGNKMLQFIYGNIKYPATARKNKIEGMVIIKYTVEKDGSINDVEVVRDIGGGCGAEAKRVVESMPDWNPGFQKGKAVRVQFNLPVKYSLE